MHIIYAKTLYNSMFGSNFFFLIHKNLCEYLRVGHESRAVDDGGGGLELDATAPALNIKHPCKKGHA